MLDAEPRGERAAQILANEVYQQAVKAAAERFKDEWGRTEDPERRDSLWHQLKAVEAVTRELTIIRDNGIVARDKREKEERRG